MYGVMQARKLITPEILFDSLLSEAVPFLFKKKYLRLLFEVYVNEVNDIENMDQHSQKFVDLFRFIVLDDLRQYCHFYTGLMSKLPPDARRDNEIEKEREKVILDLEKISKQQIYM